MNHIIPPHHRDESAWLRVETSAVASESGDEQLLPGTRHRHMEDTLLFLETPATYQWET